MYNGIDNNDYVNGQGFCCSNNVVNAPALRAMQPNDNPEKLQFYYHSDHLGSTSLITDLDGNVTQHVEYIPFGEVFIEERNATWNTPYKFNAKELDEETGLYYYGARYYDPKVSVWLGVDPMGEKYPGISVYAYCANNPIRNTDPNGKDVWDIVLGVIHSVGDNLSLGTVNTSTNGLVSNAGDYNTGRDIGDVVSMVMGVAETIEGIGTAGGGAVATVGSGGIASVVTVPVAAEGVAAAVHGALVTGKATASLMSQNGRISQAEATRGSEKGNTSSGNKNSSHANEKAKQSSGQKYNDAKSQYNDLKSKTNKTPEDKKQLDSYKRQMDHWKEKKDFSGENHSQNAKGN